MRSEKLPLGTASHPDPGTSVLEESGTANQFHAVRHVQYVWDSREGDRVIAGIQQAEDR